MTVNGYRLEPFDKETPRGGVRWGIKDQETGEWVELRGIYYSNEFHTIEAQCANLNEFQDTETNAERVGRRVGKAVASWAIDPQRMSREEMLTMLKGIQDVDPAIIDQFTMPSLNGEGDGYSPVSLSQELEIDPEDDALLADACEAWEAGVQQGFWGELERVLTEHTKEN